MNNIVCNEMNGMSDGEKLDALLGMQSQFQNTVGQLVLNDQERKEEVKKLSNQVDSLNRTVNEKLKIDEDVLADIKNNIAIKVRKFCTAHHLIYTIWSRALFTAAYGEIKRVCKAGSLTRILFSKQKLAEKTGTDMVLEDLEKVKIILVEARINNGKRLKVDPEKENYLYETIRYHIVVAQDWENVTREQIFQEAAINEVNALKY